MLTGRCKSGMHVLCLCMLVFFLFAWMKRLTGDLWKVNAMLAAFCNRDLSTSKWWSKLC